MKLGIKSIAVAKQNEIIFPFLKNIESVNLPDNIVWDKLPISNISGALTETTSQGTSNGTTKTVTVTATIVDKSGEIRSALTKYEKNHIFKVEDMNGINYLIGTNHFRSTLTFRHEIDKLSRNVYSIEITHQSPHGYLKINPSNFDFRTYFAVEEVRQNTFLNMLLASYERQSGEMVYTSIKIVSMPEWMSINNSQYPTGIRHIDPPYNTATGKYNVGVFFNVDVNTTGTERQAIVKFSQPASGKFLDVTVVQEA